jgi:leader peptidase (prepilin peptidase)/N-methyltransferase
MDAVLVTGCAAGGLAAGAVLDSLTGRIVRAPEPVAVLEPAYAGAPAPEQAPLPPAPVRVAGAGEIALSALLTGGFFALLAFRLGPTHDLVAYCALAAGLVALSVVDARAGIVPRSILYPTLAATAVGFVAASALDHHWRPLLQAAVGGSACFAVFFALWWFFPRGLGFGDVRLAGVIGAALGWIGYGELYVGFLVAFLVGALSGVVVMAVRGTGRRTKFAFGPALSVGTAFGILWGPWAVHLWLHHG